MAAIILSRSVSMAAVQQYRSVKTILPRTQQHWVGDGFHVHPVLGRHAFTAEVSPFLMLDYAVPKSFKPTRSRLGVGQHPHRGFETVTLAYQGEVEHADSAGNRGVIGAGDIQWMTAGRGIIHEEFHSTNFAKSGGTFEMVQLWVNLPKEHKMTAPRYQPIVAAETPTVPLRAVAAGEACAADQEVGKVRLISGELDGAVGPAKTFTPVSLWDVTLTTEGAPVELPVGDRDNVLLLVRKGAVVVGDDASARVGPQSLAILQKGGSTVRLVAEEAHTEVLFLAGATIDEPIAHRGPFVMNEPAELDQAMQDYSRGRMGK